jgi:type I restriction enzyme, S subunit
MIADLKPYPEYKESGLPWLGQVPRHWEVRQARHIGHLLKGVGGTREDAVSVGVPCVRYGELYTTHTYFIRTSKAFVKAERATDYTPIRYGDVLFAASGETIEEIGKSAVNLMQTSAVCGGDVIILRPNIPVHAPFLGYAMDCRPAANQKATMGRGTTVKHIYPDELRSLLFALPTLDEQAAIVRFLDWANGRLERAIRAKRKVIALLNEQKQAVIYRAITRGLDPAVPFKSSGIAWLGDIPRHWEVRRLKWVLRLQRGFDLPADRRRSGSVPVFSSGGHIDNHSVARASAPGIVIGRYGSTDAVFFVTEPYWPHNTALFTTTFYDNCARWCFFLLRSLAKGAYAGKSAVPGVDRKDLFDIGVPRPPVNEQSAIAAAIDGQLAVFDRSIAFVFKEIELLREYRSRLVADVVTGKFDVREAAARLPDNFALEAAEDDIDLDDETENADEMAAV